jgi:hypothetical protein
MTRWGRGAAAVAVASATLVALRLSSFIPYAFRRNEGALVRLAWRARGERVNECRRLTPAELARLPVHMRREEVCEGRLLPYHLVVALDSAPAVDHLVHGAGAREDRPLYVFEELPVRPGLHRLSVRFTLVGTASQAAVETDRPATPSVLVLDTAVTLGPREIALVTYDEEREQLLMRGGSRGGKPVPDP